MAAPKAGASGAERAARNSLASSPASAAAAATSCTGLCSAPSRAPRRDPGRARRSRRPRTDPPRRARRDAPRRGRRGRPPARARRSPTTPARGAPHAHSSRQGRARDRPCTTGRRRGTRAASCPRGPERVRAARGDPRPPHGPRGQGRCSRAPSPTRDPRGQRPRVARSRRDPRRRSPRRALPPPAASRRWSWRGEARPRASGEAFQRATSAPSVGRAAAAPTVKGPAAGGARAGPCPGAAGSERAAHLRFFSLASGAERTPPRSRARARGSRLTWPAGPPFDSTRKPRQREDHVAPDPLPPVAPARPPSRRPDPQPVSVKSPVAPAPERSMTRHRSGRRSTRRALHAGARDDRLERRGLDCRREGVLASGAGRRRPDPRRSRWSAQPRPGPVPSRTSTPWASTGAVPQPEHRDASVRCEPPESTSHPGEVEIQVEEGMRTPRHRRSSHCRRSGTRAEGQLAPSSDFRSCDTRWWTVGAPGATGPRRNVPELEKLAPRRARPRCSSRTLRRGADEGTAARLLEARPGRGPRRARLDVFRGDAIRTPPPEHGRARDHARPTPSGPASRTIERFTQPKTSRTSPIRGIGATTLAGPAHLPSWAEPKLGQHVGREG